MALDLTTLLRSIAAKLQDDASFLTPDEIDQFVQDALGHAELDRPLQLVVDIAGDDTQDLALPTSYIKGFSTIESVESPAGENPPVYLTPDDDWFVYEDPSKPAGQQNRLRFRWTQPAVGDNVRVVFTARYTLTVSSANLDPAEFLAVLYKALVFCYQALASTFVQSQNSSISADSVDYGSRAQNFLFLAERYEQSYKRAVGLSKDVRAAQALGEIDVVYDHGEDMIWHSRWNR